MRRRQACNRLARYRPYARQRAFHDAGADHRERLFMAGNQLGKTVAGSFEWAMHLTGRYPDWWQGRRFVAPGRYWAAGETRISTRDTVQKLLLGDPERPQAWGMGAIPGDAILTTHRAAGVANAIDAVTVAHVAGGASTLLFKAYEQGRAKWQGDTLNGVWFDQGFAALRVGHRRQPGRQGVRGEIRSCTPVGFPLAGDAADSRTDDARSRCRWADLKGRSMIRYLKKRLEERATWAAIGAAATGAAALAAPWSYVLLGCGVIAILVPSPASRDEGDDA